MSDNNVIDMSLYRKGARLRLVVEGEALDDGLTNDGELRFQGDGSTYTNWIPSSAIKSVEEIAPPTVPFEDGDEIGYADGSWRWLLTPRGYVVLASEMESYVGNVSAHRAGEDHNTCFNRNRRPEIVLISKGYGAEVVA